MTVSATPTTAAMPAASPDLVTVLQQVTQSISALLAALQAQGGSQAATGAQALGGGPGVGQAPGQAPSSGCGCGGASGAVAGAEDVGQAPPGKGAMGAPKAKGGGKHKEKDSEFKGANGAPEAQGAAGGGGGKGEQLVAEAKKYLGTKYVYGGASPSGFDCSGLMQYVAKKLGINLPRVASDQAKAGKEVGKGDLQPGDLVYFKGTTGNPGEVSHIGMYVGNGQFIHAPKTGDVVKISNLNDSYYQEHWGGARRIT